MSETAARRSAASRHALRCLLFGVGLVVLAFVVGIVTAVVGPGRDDVLTYAWAIFPGAVNLVSTPLIIAAIVLSLVSLVQEGANVRAIVSLVVGLLVLPPFAFGFYSVALLLTGNG